MKKSYAFIIALMVIVGLFYIAFRNDDRWYTQEGKFFSEENYLEDPYILEMIEKQLLNVDYVAIVYATEARTTPNSWFHRVIMDNPYDSTYYQIKAEVDYTILGAEYNTITYTSTEISPSSGKKGKSYATLVMLCGDSPSNMYPPDNGYEFAASKELIAYFKKKRKLPVTRKDPSICPK